MDLTAKHLTVKEAREYLDLNGVEWSEIWIRTLIGLGKIKSQKMYNSRIIARSELEKIVKDRKGR